MTYLYGDSTPSTLRRNFLEFLRDALDFCVYVLQADARIQLGRARIDALRRQATLVASSHGSAQSHRRVARGTRLL